MSLGIRHFSEGERDWAELTFAKTSGTDKGQEKKRPIVEAPPPTIRETIAGRFRYQCCAVIVSKERNGVRFKILIESKAFSLLFHLSVFLFNT